MATDPFNDIKRPICGELVEIGQSTFTELISVRQKTTKPAIGNATPNVAVSLKEVAFGRNCRGETQDPSTPGVFQPIPPQGSSGSAAAANATPMTLEIPTLSKYSASKNTNGVAYKKKIAGLGMAKASTEFRDLLLNPLVDDNVISAFAELAGCPGNCPDPCPENEDDVCKVDLAVVLDDTSSMGDAIAELRIGISEVADLLRTTIGQNFRFSLTTFKDSIALRLPFNNLCGDASFDAFQSSVNGVTAGRGGNIPEWSAAAVLNVVSDFSSCWRKGDVIRVIILITDAVNNGPDTPGVRSNDSGVTVDQAAQAAADCGIRVVYAGVPRNSTIAGQLAIEGEKYASITNGLQVQLPANGDGLAALLSSFIFSLCSQFIPTPECEGGVDRLLNGTFDNDLAGWTTIDATHDPTFTSAEPNDPLGSGVAKINTGGNIIQRITGLESGDFMFLNYNWCVEGTDVTITGEFRDSTGTPITILSSSGPTEILTGNACSQDRANRDPVKILVPLDGIVDVFIGASATDSGILYVDNIIACALTNDDCGSGARNLLSNSNFEEGVEFWDDGTNTALTPFTDINFWDEDIFAIIVNVTAENEIRQTLTGLTPGLTFSFNFELASHEPEVLSELALQYGTLDSSNDILAQNTVTNAELTVPQRLSIEFIVPSDGIVKVFIKNGVIGGVAKIRNCLVCDLSGICEEGFERISFDEFETNKGGWAGGTYDPIGEQILLNDTTDEITQTYPGLTPGITFQLSVNVRNSGGAVITLISSPGADQLITPTAPGYYTLETIVQDSGLIVASIKKLGSDINVDDILACQKISDPCDGSITDVQAFIEWQGEPRRPVNFFNAIVRYLTRDPLDPFSVTETTFVADSEGRLGVSTCDFWKSEISPATTILQSGLNLSLIGNINAGDFDSIAAKTNWLWSVPIAPVGGQPQDNLVINFPNPAIGALVENVKFLFLLNEAIPAIGTDTLPVNPPPLDCTPDPAVEFDIIIRFTNSIGLSREFKVPVAKSGLWNQEVDFGTNPLPWDTVSSSGNGLKGSSARWEEIDFLLDSVDGRGLDQCTTPLFFAADGSGDLLFKEFELKGTGIFVDPCDSEIIIEDISSGDVANEIQSIILPPASGGSWTLAFTYAGSTETVGLPFDTTAAQLRVRLGTLPNIGGTVNIDVTGLGTPLSPFLVTFQGDLGAIDHEILVADGSSLTGSASAMVSTENDGTENERQRISNPTDGRQDLIITYAGNASVPIPYDSSLNTVQSALEGIIGIGAGNILITGDITDRDAAYAGPYIADFIGALAITNVVQMIAAPTTYIVSTDWNGGIGNGQNEKQLVEVNAFGGSYSLRVFNIGSGVPPSITTGTTQEGNVSGADSYVYWADYGGLRIQRALKDIWTPSTVTTNTVDFTAGVRVDEPLGKVFFCRPFTGEIISVNTDGTSVTTVVSGQAQPFDIDLDRANQHIYFVTQEEIKRVNYDGTGLITLATISGMGASPFIHGIVLDLETGTEGKIYFTDSQSASFSGGIGTIYRIDRDGANLTALFSNELNPYKITLDVVRGLLYWGAEGVIRRGNTNGTGVSNWLSAGNVLSIDYDPTEDKIYHSRGDQIWRINSDLTIPEAVIADIGASFADGMDYAGVAGAVDEVQTITLQNVTDGTYKLALEGEVTADIPADATVDAFRVAVLALPNVTDIAVTKTGVLPADVVYTVTFQGVDGGRNWDEFIPDGTNLVGGGGSSEFADTAPIAFDAGPDIVESSLVAAASFLTVADLNVGQVLADVPNGRYIWRVEFTGSFAVQDVPQMQAFSDGLTGSPIQVVEIQPGSGTNDRQRLTMINATGGSFKLTVTIDLVDYKTSAITWNTTAAGLQAQLLALAPFSPEDLTVIDVPLTNSNQQARFVITFKKKFGNVPLMIPDFQQTLLCNPIILPHVDPGPYPYPLPDCCDLDEDLSCQSGPLLCIPCEGDEPIELEPCCDADTIPESVNCSTRLDFQRDLFDPNSISTPGCAGINGKRFTIRDLAVLKGLNPTDYVPYTRNFRTQRFIPTSYSTIIETKMSIILIENELDTKRGHQRVTEHLRGHREILPTRFVWPDCDVTVPVPAEVCWPGIGES